VISLIIVIYALSVVQSAPISKVGEVMQDFLLAAPCGADWYLSFDACGMYGICKIEYASLSASVF
jgi:hypothetical protein